MSADTPRTDKKRFVAYTDTTSGQFEHEVVFASDYADLERELAAETDKRVHFARKCVDYLNEIDQLKAYADKLADGLPEGMLPKDVEVLREANAGLAAEVERLKGELMAASVDACAQAMQKRELRARVAELEQDRDRLDWLIKNQASLASHIEIWDDEPTIWWAVVKNRESISGHPLPDLRQAIDAARSA